MILLLNCLFLSRIHRLLLTYQKYSFNGTENNTSTHTFSCYLMILPPQYFYIFPKCPDSASSFSLYLLRPAPPSPPRRRSRLSHGNKRWDHPLLSPWTPSKTTIRKPTGRTNTHPPRSWDQSCPRCPPACWVPSRLCSWPCSVFPLPDPPNSNNNPGPLKTDRGSSGTMSWEALEDLLPGVPTLPRGSNARTECKTSVSTCWSSGTELYVLFTKTNDLCCKMMNRQNTHIKPTHTLYPDWETIEIVILNYSSAMLRYPWSPLASFLIFFL